jgi:hypothetical protein
MSEFETVKSFHEDTLTRQNEILEEEKEDVPLKRKRGRPKGPKKEFNKGKWMRDEILIFFACKAISFKYGIKFSNLRSKFLKSRTSLQVLSRFRNEKDLSKTIIKFWEDKNDSMSSELTHEIYEDSVGENFFNKIKRSASNFLCYYQTMEALNMFPEIQIASSRELTKLSFINEERTRGIFNRIDPNLIMKYKKICILINEDDFKLLKSYQNNIYPEESQDLFAQFRQSQNFSNYDSLELSTNLINELVKAQIVKSEMTLPKEEVFQTPYTYISAKKGQKNQSPQISSDTQDNTENFLL